MILWSVLKALNILVILTNIVKYSYCSDTNNSLTPSIHNSQNENISLKPLNLDISKKQSSKEYNYSKDNNNTETYTAKQGYGFNKVFQKKTLGGENVIWEPKPDNKTKYVNKILMEGDSKLTLTLTDGSTKQFEKTGGLFNKKWTETTPTTKEDKPNEVSQPFSHARSDIDISRDTKSLHGTHTTPETNTVEKYHGHSGFDPTVIGDSSQRSTEPQDPNHQVKVILGSESDYQLLKESQNNKDQKDNKKQQKESDWNTNPVTHSSTVGQYRGDDQFKKTEESVVQLGRNGRLTVPSAPSVDQSGTDESETSTTLEDKQPVEETKTEDKPEPSVPETPTTLEDKPPVEETKTEDKPEPSVPETPTTLEDKPPVEETKPEDKPEPSVSETPTTLEDKPPVEETKTEDKPEPSVSETSTSPSKSSDILITLDISKKQSSKEYNYSKDNNNTETFIANRGYKFEKIIRGTDTLWEHKDNKYQTKVILTTDDQGKVNITYDNVKPPGKYSDKGSGYPSVAHNYYPY